jgi:hypothetical protein
MKIDSPMIAQVCKVRWRAKGFTRISGLPEPVNSLTHLLLSMRRAPRAKSENRIWALTGRQVRDTVRHRTSVLCLALPSSPSLFLRDPFPFCSYAPYRGDVRRLQEKESPSVLRTLCSVHLPRRTGVS